MPIDVTGSRAKVQRAKEHFQDLVAKASNFARLNPYGVVTYDDPETGVRVWLARVSQPVPPEWSLLVGDVLHNLRTALDYVAWQLQSSGKRAIEKSDPFPVWDRGRKSPTRRDLIKGLDATRERQIAAFGVTGYALIERVQPDSRRDRPLEVHPLWLLHHLDIWDKHKLLVVAGATVRQAGGHIGGPGEDVHIDFMSIGGPHLAVVPLADGAELMRLKLGDDTPNVDMKLQYAFFVAFANAWPGKGEPVIETLDKLITYVDSVVTMFAALP
jgi:hypothetical protein